MTSLDAARRPAAPNGLVPAVLQPPELLQEALLEPTRLAAEIHAALRAEAVVLSPKFFYDPLGSRLFDAITQLDEYDLTRTEAAIHRAHAGAIAAACRAAVGARPTLVDLGAGDGVKAARLFAALQPARYVAVDVSVAYVQEALLRLQRAWPEIAMRGLGTDFSAQLSWPEAWRDGQPALVLFPGSSIGNFSPSDAQRLLAEAREVAQGGALLIGVDLLKPVAEMEAAYDDALGVTAAFNRNLLRHCNALAGTDFSPRGWQHQARFCSGPDRIEMRLVARQAQRVCWPGGTRGFAAGESIHTENAHKWSLGAFDGLLRSAGWARVQSWTDPRQRFAVCLAQG